jgi:CRP-like cAMP-binding protein
MLESKVELLEKVPLLQGLMPEQLGAIAQIGTKKYFESGEPLIQEGVKGEASYLIITGKASYPRIERDQSFEQDLWPGTLVGELAMIVETVHPMTVTAKERVRALAFDRDGFRKVMESDPGIAQHIAEKLLVRLHSLAADLRKVDHFLERLENDVPPIEPISEIVSKDESLAAATSAS